MDAFFAVLAGLVAVLVARGEFSRAYVYWRYARKTRQDAIAALERAALANIEAAAIEAKAYRPDKIADAFDTSEPLYVFKKGPPPNHTPSQ